MTENKDAPASIQNAVPGTTDVSAAFALGWQMARLYESQDVNSRVAMGDKDDPSEYLPGLSDLSPALQTELGLNQADVGIGRLANFVQDPKGLTTRPTRIALKQRPVDREAVRAQILLLHNNLLLTLTAADFKLGKAYGLGRALADTCLDLASPENQTTGASSKDQPETESREQQRTEQLQRHLARHLKPGRAWVLRGWLDDLKSALPSHAAESVIVALEQWVRWADAKPATRTTAPTANRPATTPATGPDPTAATSPDPTAATSPDPTPATGPDPTAATGPDPAAPPVLAALQLDELERTVAALHRCGQRWRAVLSGEKDATDLLETSDYVIVFQSVLKRAGRMAWSVIRQLAIPLALAAALVVAGLVLMFLNNGTAQVLAGLGTVASGLGLTWRTAPTLIARDSGGLRHIIWEAELDVVIGHRLITDRAWEIIGGGNFNRKRLFLEKALMKQRRVEIEASKDGPQEDNLPGR